MTVPDRLIPIIKACQEAAGAKPDGDPWDETWKAIYKKLTGKDWPEPVIGSTEKAIKPPAPDTDISIVDDRSEKNIATLHENIRDLARRLVIESGEQGIDVRIIDGSRTWEQQDALYANGRTKPGNIVTNARGGQSWHNYGIAFDVGVFQDGRYVKEGPAYRRVGAIGKSLGFEWGGDWKGSLVDEPHFQWNPMKLTLGQVRERKENGQAYA